MTNLMLMNSTNPANGIGRTPVDLHTLKCTSCGLYDGNLTVISEDKRLCFHCSRVPQTKLDATPLRFIDHWPLMVLGALGVLAIVLGLSRVW